MNCYAYMYQPELLYWNNSQSLSGWHMNNEGLRQFKYRYNPFSFNFSTFT